MKESIKNLFGTTTMVVQELVGYVVVYIMFHLSEPVWWVQRKLRDRHK